MEAIRATQPEVLVSRVSRACPFVVASLALTAGCGGGTTGPDPVPTLAIHEGNNQTATVAQAVGVPPAVRVTSGGSGVAGASVTFSVTPGSGSITGATATTDANGVARVGSWTLGQAAGANTLQAQLVGSQSTVGFTATGTADVPVAVTKVAGDNQAANARATVLVPPTVRVSDQFDNPVQGVQVVFSVTAGNGTVTGGTQVTNAAGVAILGSWALGPTGGPNRVTATVQTPGLADQPVLFEAMALEVVLQPAQDTVLVGGTLQLTRLVIPAGRIVTATGALVLNVDSSVTIEGTLRGNCVAITLNGAQDVVVSGLLDNACGDVPDDPPALTVVGLGGYDLSGAVISTGDITITNDPTLTEDDVPDAAAMARVMRAPRRANGGFICGAKDLSMPQARRGTDGQHGTNGRNARTAYLRCRGDLSVGGTIAGQNGGDGGNGTDLVGTANASGGHGGEGGRLVVTATGIVGLGPGSTLRSGRGGNGGQATALATESDAGPRAPGATAIGGRGGDPGLITVRAGNGIQVSPTAEFELGRGGHGGGAVAGGARGKDATAAKDAQHGGHALARGGAGGGLDANRLRAFGNVLGAPPVRGGVGGIGGAAAATGGNGGDSDVEERPRGGGGGNITAEGGKGGDALARNLQGNLFARGGNGGSATLKGGNGGRGWHGCPPPNPGGNGGEGGNGDGGDGAGGAGAPDGEAGGVTYENVGTGGKAGDGVGPGARGPKGNEGGVNVRKGPPVRVGKTFELGDPGTDCGVPPGKGAVRVRVNIPEDVANPPALLGEIRKDGEAVAQITQTDQTVVLDPGVHTLVMNHLDPDGYRHAATCVEVGVPAQPVAAGAPEPVPCLFTVVVAQIVEVVVTYAALRALVQFNVTGLPADALAAAILMRCLTTPCAGPTKPAVFPAALFLFAALWSATLPDHVVVGPSSRDIYRAIPLAPFVLLAGALHEFLVRFYLFQRWFYYATGIVVKLDPFLHAAFIAMWSTAVLILTRSYPPPLAELTSGEETDVEISIAGPPPWVTVTGILKPDGSITASGTGTVAGFPNVPVSFTGQLNPDGTLTGEYRMGQDTPPTGLPGGAIVYQVNGAPTAPPPAAAPR